jgi:hypothetical protein
MEDLNKTQFVYKREIVVPPVEENTEKGIIGADGYTKTVYDSFNINLVIRSMVMDDGRTLVLLDDLHERAEEVPNIDHKRNKVIGMKRQRNTFQSEIYLSKEDGKEFLKLTAINSYE